MNSSGRKILGRIGVFTLLFWGSLTSLRATTYYIDYQGGQDANDGLTKLTPWQCHPFMHGWSGGNKYTHAPGDQFIFKGGVTWPNAAFQMHIATGGYSSAKPDYYGVDLSWASTTPWRRPVFDFEDIIIGTGWNTSAGVLLDYVRFIVFDNIEAKRHNAPPAGPGWGATTFSLLTCGDIVFQNCLIHDWTCPIVNPGDDGGGGIQQTNGGGPIKILHCVFHQTNATVKSGRAISAGGEFAFNEFFDLPNAVLGGGDIHDNVIHDLTAATDPNSHSNGVETFGPSTIYNNIIFNCDNSVSPISVEAGWDNHASHAFDVIYNNLLYRTGWQTPINVDTSFPVAPTNGAKIYNNTSINDKCIRVQSRPTLYHLGSLDVRNNLCIINGNPFGPICYNNDYLKCAVIDTVIDTNNVVVTLLEAQAAGYSWNTHFAPPAGDQYAIDQGADLSALGFNTDRLGVSRPQGLRWDVGATEYKAAPEDPGKPEDPVVVTPEPDATPQPPFKNIFFPQKESFIAIPYFLDAPARVTMVIYDRLGQQVLTLLDSDQTASGSVNWNGRNEKGETVASGNYFVSLRSGSKTEIKRVVVIN